MSRWILLTSLVAVVVAGYLLAVLVPRDTDEPERRTPIVVTTQTIPAAQP